MQYLFLRHPLYTLTAWPYATMHCTTACAVIPDPHMTLLRSIQYIPIATCGTDFHPITEHRFTRRGGKKRKGMSYVLRHKQRHDLKLCSGNANFVLWRISSCVFKLVFSTREIWEHTRYELICNAIICFIRASQIPLPASVLSKLSNSKLNILERQEYSGLFEDQTSSQTKHSNYQEKPDCAIYQFEFY